MVAWNENREMARKRGSLAMEFFCVVTTPVKSFEELKAVLPEHLEYQMAQQAAGNLALAGPLSDMSGEEMQGEGMIIYRAESMEAARALADGDPMHREGIRTYTLRKWLVNEANFSV